MLSVYIPVSGMYSSGVVGGHHAVPRSICDSHSLVLGRCRSRASAPPAVPPFGAAASPHRHRCALVPRGRRRSGPVDLRLSTCAQPSRDRPAPNRRRRNARCPTPRDRRHHLRFRGVRHSPGDPPQRRSVERPQGAPFQPASRLARHDTHPHVRTPRSQHPCTSGPLCVRVHLSNDLRSHPRVRPCSPSSATATSTSTYQSSN